MSFIMYWSNSPQEPPPVQESALSCHREVEQSDTEKLERGPMLEQGNTLETCGMWRRITQRRGSVITTWLSRGIQNKFTRADLWYRVDLFNCPTVISCNTLPHYSPRCMTIINRLRLGIWVIRVIVIITVTGKPTLYSVKPIIRIFKTFKSLVE